MTTKVFGWTVDRQIAQMLDHMLADAKRERPDAMDSDQVELNTALCVLVELGVADLMRKKNGRPYWGCRVPLDVRDVMPS